MRWFLDTEFSERGHQYPVELISIGLVSEAGESYYAVSNEFDADGCNDWVKQNVLTRLPEKRYWKRRSQISKDIKRLISASIKEDPAIEFWGYFSDYDWVVFCQLFGTMIELPKGWPMFCHDLMQEMKRLSIRREHLPANPGAHDALVDAEWTKDAYHEVRQIECMRLLDP